MRYLLIFLVLILTYSCSNDKVTKAKQYISSSLKDPHSIKFRNVRAFHSNVCGELNAKNSYGAYVGYVGFHVGFIGDSIYTSELSSPDETFIYDHYCTSKHQTAKLEKEKKDQAAMLEKEKRIMSNDEVITWLELIATRNGCSEPINIGSKIEYSEQVKFNLTCSNKKLEIVCSTPIFRPTDYSKLPNCWI